MFVGVCWCACRCVCCYACCCDCLVRAVLFVAFSVVLGGACVAVFVVVLCAVEVFAAMRVDFLEVMCILAFGIVLVAVILRVS